MDLLTIGAQALIIAAMLAFLAIVVPQLLPQEFSFYTLDEFQDTLDSFTPSLSYFMGAFGFMIDWSFFLIITKIMFLMIIAGLSFKVIMLFFSMLRGGGGAQ
jgi:hypothetical protein